MKSFLIIKTSAIGDVIQTLPAVKALKSLYPEAFIHWICEKNIESLLSSYDFIDKVIAIDTKKWKKAFFKKKTWEEVKNTLKELRKNSYDVVFDMQGNSKSGLLSFFAKSSNKVGFDKEHVAEWPNLLFTHHKIKMLPLWNAYKCYKNLIFNYLNKEVSKSYAFSSNLQTTNIEPVFNHIKKNQSLGLKVAVVGFSSNWQNKKVPLPALLEFLQYVKAKFKVEFIIPYLDKEKEEALHLEKALSCLALENLSFAECENVIAASDAFIGVDSALLHLAQITQTPTFGLFGPSSSVYYMEEERKFATYQGRCPYGKSFTKRCDVLRSCKDAPCLKKIDQKQLFNSFDHFWESMVISTHHFD